MMTVTAICNTPGCNEQSVWRDECGNLTKLSEATQEAAVEYACENGGGLNDFVCTHSECEDPLDCIDPEHKKVEVDVTIDDCPMCGSDRFDPEID